MSNEAGCSIYSISNDITQSSVMNFQSAGSENRIEVDFKAGTINLIGSWDDNAKLFMNAVQMLLRQNGMKT